MLAELKRISVLDRETLGGRVYRDICTLLMSGRVTPGQSLSLRSIADAMDVSVMPVRDAVSRLVAEKALEFAKNRTIQVPVTTKSGLRELALIRVEIEGFAAEQAALNRSEAELAGIIAADAAYRASCYAPQPDRAIAMRDNMELHFSIYRASQMPSLVEIIEALWLRAGPMVYLGNAGNLDWLVAGGASAKHAEAVAAIAAKDGAGARRAVAEDIWEACLSIVENGALSD